jgi:3alpha(or 20beta)-hydroxysteroid dehydrogenase
MRRLAGKVALISGGARGLGAAHARAIVQQGGQVVIGDLLEEEVRALVNELGPHSVGTHLDVTSLQSWIHAVELAVSTFGHLNVLVNNAGILNQGRLGEYTLEQWNLCMSVNVTGTFLGLTAARSALVAAAPSSVINISSDAGMHGVPALHGYVAAKFAVRGLTKSAAMELGPQGVRVNSVHPGIIRTPMTEGMHMESMFGVLGRAGEPEDIASMVVFLASDESSFSTGSEFIADGGRLCGSADMEEA